MSDLRSVLIVALTGAILLTLSIPAAFAFDWLAKFGMIATAFAAMWLVAFSWGWFKTYGWLDRMLSGQR